MPVAAIAWLSTRRRLREDVMLTIMNHGPSPRARPGRDVPPTSDALDLLATLANPGKCWRAQPPSRLLLRHLGTQWHLISSVAGKRAASPGSVHNRGRQCRKDMAVSEDRWTIPCPP
jgi:hypothetical protein